METDKIEVLSETAEVKSTEEQEVFEGEFSPQPPMDGEASLEGEVIDTPVIEEPFVEPEFITQVFYEEVYNIPEDCVEVAPPSFYKPKWDGEQWIEVGERPADPPHVPTADEKIVELQEENLINMMAMTDMYEENIRLKEDNMNTMLALTEMYEILMG